MPYLPVDLYVKNVSAPVQGVVVRVYSQNGAILYTQDISDAAGHVGFLLPSEMSPFQCRFYKASYTFENPLYINVTETDPNVFDVPTTTVVPPIPMDLRLCTAFGFFRDILGRPLRGTRIHFIPKFLPLTLDGAAILTGNVTVTTDEAGYAKVDLIRCGMYEATVYGQEDYVRQVSVPDAANVSLPDLLLPLVTEITFSPAVPTAMTVAGGEVVLTPTILLTGGKAGIMSDVQWSSSDSNVLAVLPSGNSLTLRPLSAGTAELRAVRQDNSIIRIPDPGITGVPVTVVIT